MTIEFSKNKNMPIAKIKKTSKKKETPIQALETLVKKDDKEIRSELNYFKGLSIMITVLIVVVFFTFGCLFSALYMETRAMSQAIRLYVEDTHQYLSADIKSEEIATVAPSGYGPQQVKLDIKISTADWRSFEKYGVKVFFPKEWTFADDPYAKADDTNKTPVKAIRIFADGKVHELSAGEKGDIYVQISDKEIIFNGQQIAKDINDEGPTYSAKTGEGVNVSELPVLDMNGGDDFIWRAIVNGKYYYIHYMTQAGREIMDQILQTIQFTK